MTQSELIDLEQTGWRALSSSGEAAAEFYERVLDGEVVMLLPGGMVLDKRAAIVQSMSGPPWSSYELEDLRVLQSTPDTGVVTYSVVAQREGTSEYSALMSSVYVRREDGWKWFCTSRLPARARWPALATTSGVSRPRFVAGRRCGVSRRRGPSAGRTRTRACPNAARGDCCG